MIPMPGLAADELQDLADDMRLGPYLMRPSVQLLTRDHDVLSDLSGRVTEGQVDCSLDGLAASRSATITVYDPTRVVAIDGADASDGGLFYDKMVSAGIAFKGPRIGRWVTIPIFCGPLTNASRSGNTAQIVAQDKARLAGGMIWNPRVYPRGTDKVTAITDLLVQSGEASSRIKVPGIATRLPKDLRLERTDRAWTTGVVPIAQSMDRQAFYDGRGDFRLRSWPEDPAVVFRDGDGGTILTNPEVAYNAYESGFNGIVVQGPLKNTGKRIEVVLWLPPDHPLSPTALARGGVPFRVAYMLANTKVRTQQEAEDLGYRWLRKMVQQTVNVTVDVMPNWLLEPGDVIAFQTPALGHLEQQLKSFSLPLTAGASMSLGAIKRVSRPIRRPTAKRPAVASSHAKVVIG